MTLPRASEPRTGRARLRGAWTGVARRAESGERRVLLLLVVPTLVGGVGVAGSRVLPPALLALPLVTAGLVLRPRSLPWFVVFVLTVAGVAVPSQGVTAATVVQVAVVVALGVIVLEASFRRTRLGVAGTRGESMFVDLRDRLQRQAGVPELPEEWYAESVLRSAGGTPFAGDFVVAARCGSGDRLDVAVVDVSGKGEDAGTRALLLSGAFGGLLGAVPAEAFLRAANDFLVRQDWEEGFATAIHLSVQLDSGDFQVRTAGHPPAVHFVAGSGRWLVHQTEGPVLGLLADQDFPPHVGTMRSGDALLLYTDGLVETKDRDIALGIDKLVGQAERLLQGGFESGATRLVEALGSRHDDRALLLLHRR